MLTDIEYYMLRRRLALRKVAGFAACRPYRYYLWVLSNISLGSWNVCGKLEISLLITETTSMPMMAICNAE